MELLPYIDTPVAIIVVYLLLQRDVKQLGDKLMARLSSISERVAHLEGQARCPITRQKLNEAKPHE